MNDTPNNQVTDVAKQRPKLVIFDDSAKLLARFAESFTKLGYEVIPVYVSDGNTDDNLDRFIASGKFKRGILNPVEFDSYRDEKDAPAPVPEDTLDAEMARLERKKKTPSDRHASAYDHLKALSAFPYAVKSKEDVANILREVKPDLVLSDMEMRRPADPDMSKEDQAMDDDTVMGNHIMAIAARVTPNAPRAIHTGMFTINDDLRERINGMDEKAGKDEEAFWNNRYAQLCASANADPEVKATGYHIFPKDETGQSTRTQEIDAYFKKQLARGRGEGPTPA